MRKTEFAYKQDHPFEKRVAEAARIREKYPDRIPVICEKDVGSDIPAVDKRKYLIPMDLTVGQFVYVIRKRISIPSDKAIFIFVNNSLPPTAALMSTVYEQHKDQDGFMCASSDQTHALASPYALTHTRFPSPIASQLTSTRHPHAQVHDVLWGEHVWVGNRVAGRGLTVKARLCHVGRSPHDDVAPLLRSREHVSLVASLMAVWAQMAGQPPPAATGPN